MAGRKFVNGTTGVQLHPDRLDHPLKWKRPRRIFVNSLSDLFHEAVPDAFIDQVFAVMALTPWHSYQLLTKRPERMQQYCSSPDRPFLQNCWKGVSVENQATADERIPLLLQTPAAVRFISAEPLLGLIDLRLNDETPDHDGCYEDRRHGLHWAIVGGESGPGARTCDLAWIRSIREQCRIADIPVFVKQLGAKPLDHTVTAMMMSDKKGGNIAEWPFDVRVREYPR